MTDTAIGIDFGTTNTVVALARHGEPVRVVRHAVGEGVVDVFRSVLCFERNDIERRLHVDIDAGHAAIARYLAATGETRFIQSFKSHVASPLFRDTGVFATRYRFEDLLATFLGRLLAEAGQQLPPGGVPVVAGRPVTFAGAAPDEALAHRRYDAAYQAAGLGAPVYVHEPVGAAYYYAQRLDHDATILVGDFGGGTSDFSIIRFERREGALRAIPVGSAGLGVAGDSFDYRIINAVVSPHLGKGSQYRSMGKVMEVPAHYYANFARWHQLALLKSAEHQRELEKLKKIALKPELIGRLMDVIEQDWGFLIYRAVSEAKVALSEKPEALFRFAKGDIAIEARITVGDFEGWIAEDLARIDRTVVGLLARHQLAEEAIDRVFLTGGSSHIPAVRRLFAGRFGAERMDSGGEFESIAHGLALIGLEPDQRAWAVTPRAA
jgi:hypothetical chaperone protein